MAEQLRENKMGVMPVGRLLVSMSLPIMLSMLVQALYNVVDSIFVAQLSEDALTAVSLAFPFQNLMIAVAVGTGVGVNALLSRSLGEKKFDVANKAAGNGVLLSLLSSLVFIVLGVLLARPFFEAQRATAEIVEMGVEYLTIVGGLSLGLFVSIMFERLLQSTGKTIFTMITQGLGAIINIIFDPLLIFGIGPFPAMGVAGAAVATVLGQFMGGALTVFFHFCFNREIRLTWAAIRPDGGIIARIYAVGVPSIVMNAIGTVMTFAMNRILMALTSTAAAVFGIYFKVQSFAFMPIFGLNNGMVPIVAYNYGARKRKRLEATVRLSMILAVAIMLVGLVVLQTAAEPILKLFKASQSMLDIGVPALRTISLSFVFAGFCVISSSVFQALGRGIQSMVVSIVRQLVVLIPVAYLLSLSGSVAAVWYAVPIAECFSLILCVVFLIRTHRQIIAPLGEEETSGQASPAQP